MDFATATCRPSCTPHQQNRLANGAVVRQRSAENSACSVRTESSAKFPIPIAIWWPPRRAPSCSPYSHRLEPASIKSTCCCKRPHENRRQGQRFYGLVMQAFSPVQAAQPASDDFSYVQTSPTTAAI